MVYKYWYCARSIVTRSVMTNIQHTLRQLALLRHQLKTVNRTFYTLSVPTFHVQRARRREANCPSGIKFSLKYPGCVNKRIMYNAYAGQSRDTSSFTGKDKDIIFRQLLEYKSFTYTYLLADPDSKEAILIDPVIETVDRDIKLIQDMGLTLIYGVNTHVHADHITGTGGLKAKIPTCKSVISQVSTAKADVKITHGDKIKFGKHEIEARSTPGHTGGCMSYVWHEKGMVFTGDALLVRGCGRTDFQEGNPSQLYDSVHNQILSLPDHFTLFPAHDYTGQTMTTVAEEKQFNPRLSKSKSEFVEIMKNLNLPYPKQIDKALPANLLCGIQP